MWKLNNTAPNNQLVKEEIIREIKKYFDFNEHTHTQKQNHSIPKCTVCNDTIAVLRNKFLNVSTYIKKNFLISNLYFYLKKLEKEE